MEELNGKVAFVTGAASGIGLGMARAFSEQGMKVVLADIEAEALEKAEKALRAGGGEVVGVRCDVSDRASVEAAAEQAIETFGKVHVLCNNAGVSPVGPLESTTPGDWEWAIGVNLMGVVYGIQSIVPRIKQHGEGGHVVNTSSIAGLMPIPTLGIYSATKYAVVGISETLRAELAADNIGVSVLCPSFVKTRLSQGVRNRPENLGATGEFPEFVRQAIDSGLETSEVAKQVLEAIRANAPFIITHPEAKDGLQLRMEGLLAACDRA